jgi:membrane protein implicated in regulation of membrane protease activity
MTMQWFSDLVIVIFGLGATVALIIFSVLGIMCYLRVRRILDSVKETTQTVESITRTVEAEVAGPLGQVISVIRGVREGLGFFSSFRGDKKKRGS